MKQAIRVGELMSSSSGDVCIISASSSIVDACTALAERGVSSAPVYDSADHAFKGLLDFRDLSKFLVTAADQQHHLLTPNTEIQRLIEAGMSLSTEARWVTDLSMQNPLKGVHRDDLVRDVVREQFLNDIHRVCVFDNGGGFIGMLSQSDVVGHLFKTRNEGDEIWGKTIGQLGIVGKRNVVSLGENQTVKEAIVKMNSENVSSIALVDEDGVLVGTFSISDVKYLIKASKFEYLRESCVDYISSVRQYQSVHEHHGKDTFPAFSVHQNTKLVDAVGKLVATRTHRMFITEHGKAIGVLTLTDVLEALS